MDSTRVSLYRDFKHGKRFKAEKYNTGTNNQNIKLMPTLPRTKPCHKPPTGESFRHMETSQRLICTRTPPPSLQSQSLPRIGLHGNSTRQRHHHSNSYSNHLPAEDDMRLVMPSIQYRTTHSLPSLSQSKPCGKSLQKGLKKDIQRCLAFDLFKTSRLGRRTATNRQSFAWDFSPRSDKVSLDTDDKPVSKHSTQSPRPVHLYMSVEMMDKLLEKRKGLRSDKTLNELIGMPPSKMTDSDSLEKKNLSNDSLKMKCKRLEGKESSVLEHEPCTLEMPCSEEPQGDVVSLTDKLLEKRKGLRSDKTLNELIGMPPSKMTDSDSLEKKNLSNDSLKMKCKRLEGKESSVLEHEPCTLEMPCSEEPQGDAAKDESASQGKMMEEDLTDNEMESDFEDEEEKELGGLVEEGGAELFDEDEGEDKGSNDQEGEVSEEKDEEIEEDLSEQDEDRDELYAEVEAGDEESGEQEDEVSDDDTEDELTGVDEEDGDELFDEAEVENEGSEEQEDDVSDEKDEEDELTGVDEEDGDELFDEAEDQEEDEESDEQDDEDSDEKDELISDDDEDIEETPNGGGIRKLPKI